MYQLVCDLALSGNQKQKIGVGHPFILSFRDFIDVNRYFTGSPSGYASKVGREGEDIESVKSREVSPEGKSKLKKFSRRLREIIKRRIIGGDINSTHRLSRQYFQTDRELGTDTSESVQKTNLEGWIPQFENLLESLRPGASSEDVTEIQRKIKVI